MKSPLSLLAMLLAILLAVCGCASVAPPTAPLPPSAASAAAPSAPADRQAATPAALARERQWLQSWFDGTPVRIAQGADGAIASDARAAAFTRATSAV